jgi:hypothetical protein
MDPKDFPKRYGGDLVWDWGDMPHLDDETRAALETDGNKGWVRGPCLWLDGKRVPVGSEKGKPRRPIPDVEKLKPVVYAADYTETPVHPEKKLSIVSKARVPSGAEPAHHEAEEHAAEATGGATAANIIATETNSEQAAQVPQPQSPEPQPVPSTTSTSEVYAHPPSQPQPGPVPEYTVALTSAIDNKLADESVSIIPPTANGHANGHATAPSEGGPEVVVASDLSKGLAIEAEKLQITDDPHQKEGGAQRPGIERFVTAQEV